MVLSHLVIRSEKDQIRSLCHTKRENTFKMGLKTNIEKNTEVFSVNIKCVYHS